MDRDRDRNQRRGGGHRGPGQYQGQYQSQQGSYQGQGRGRGRGQSSYGGNQPTTQSAALVPSPSITAAEDRIRPAAPVQADHKNGMPQRPKYGNQGREVTLRANCVELKVDEEAVLHRYDIVFLENPEKPIGKKLARVISLLLEQINEPDKIVTDFAGILISCKELQTRSFEISYRDEDDKKPSKEEKYIIKIVHEWSMSISTLYKYLRDPTEPCEKEKIAQALNIFLNHFPMESKDHATIGSSRSFLHSDRESTTPIGRGLIAIKGYYSSIQLATLRILVNINVSFGVFYPPGDLKDIVIKYMHKSSSSKASPWEVANFLKGLRIKRKYHTGDNVRQVRTIFDLASEQDGTEKSGEKIKNPPIVAFYGAPAKKVKFWFNDGYITVFDFFKKQYKLEIDDTLPVINVGTRAKPTYLPPDRCTVLVGQRVKINLDQEEGIKSMIDVAVRNPQQDANDISPGGVDAIGLLSSSGNQGKRLNNFGFSIPAPELITVKGRILPTPSLKYFNGTVRDAISWNLAYKKLGRFINDRSSRKELICVVIKASNSVDPKKVNELCQNLRGMGININDPKRTEIINVPNSNQAPADQLARLFADCQKNRLDCLLVVLPDKKPYIYNCVKRLADTKFGLTTVCIANETLGRGTKSLAGNIALKFNLKFNNYNQRIDMPDQAAILDLKETMIVGIDVTHSPAQNAPSIAGMVASIDENLGQWPAILQQQKKKGEEMVAELQHMLTTRLKLWFAKHRRYPSKILVYRDGVSEGQYKLVRSKELPQLEEACAKLYPRGQPPKLTIVVVGKRHHMRFYDASGNPAPGTVVDRGVTEALSWDFFLQPHKPFKGTARPAHYFVVHDQIFRDRYGSGAANKLETFTLGLCYVFGRTTGAVSICTPAYYADIVCQRARCYADDSTGLGNLVVHDRLKDTMFYI
ncbi:Piwi-domain-containing protein [Jackrogersella minutella]|nr:Piwi-domain-containing protein [Jackrogersella minutella]